MQDDEGTFAEWQKHNRPCQQGVANGERCGAQVWRREWESSDGDWGVEQYRCEAGHYWWIDGIDS
jgi:hypothetical protein